MAVGLICVAAAPASAAQPIVRVEEDWELVVGEPDLTTNGPQVTTVITPLNNVNGVHATFEVNHQTQPGYVAGGMQVQVWNGETPVAAKKGSKDGQLHHAGEAVRWTQSMELQGGNLIFEVSDGNSSSWGTFGGQGYLRLSVGTSLSNLNGYNPDCSADHTGIGYGSNRVAILVLKEVRIYDAQGLIATDSTQRVVHESQ